jgi:hypothetical protein
MIPQIQTGGLITKRAELAFLDPLNPRSSVHAGRKGLFLEIRSGFQHAR